jgi:hypothetical protein
METGMWFHISNIVVLFKLLMCLSFGRASSGFHSSLLPGSRQWSVSLLLSRHVSSLIAVFFCLSQVFLILNLNGKFTFFPFHRWYKFELNSARNSRGAQRGTFFRYEWRRKVEGSSPVRLPLAMQMFQIPALITLTIAGTQIYRSLLHFSTDEYDLVTLPWSPYSCG